MQVRNDTSSMGSPVEVTNLLMALQFSKHGIDNVDRVVNHQGHTERCSCGKAAGLQVAKALPHMIDDDLRRGLQRRNIVQPLKALQKHSKGNVAGFNLIRLGVPPVRPDIGHLVRLVSRILQPH